ncbi:MAG: membrane protein insertion efficiency factor YidD [Clostridia bacterium]|nr:membrane protein insertion efficiency factor YidD [Clostridia bacterium]
MDDQKGKTLKIPFFSLVRENWRYLRKTVFKPYLKGLCMRMILFYQKHLSKHTCLYRPTCSQYTMECINNHGVIVGILLGSWRILRCNPLSKGGYDPAPERYFKKRWLL